MFCTGSIFIETIENTLWAGLERGGISSYIFLFFEINTNNENTKYVCLFFFFIINTLPLLYQGHSLKLNTRR